MLFLAPGYLLAQDLNTLKADTIIKRVEENLNGKTAVLNLTMSVQTRRGLRSVKMITYSIGKEKSFIIINYPKKDKGITFLKISNAMWQYVPRIERVIKIPASMMMQSWMGSDLTNDDLMKESSILDDYSQRLLMNDGNTYNIELIPHDEAPVVWGKIIMSISKQYFLPITVQYYDETGQLIRIISYETIKKFGSRFYPTHWVVSPQEEKKLHRKTTIDITQAVFDQPIKDNYFTKAALRRLSN